MLYNKKMENYLNDIIMNNEIHEMSYSDDLKIMRNKNCNGEPYFYLEHNCCNLTNMSKINSIGEMLTQLEWDCNEIYINDSEDIISLLKIALLRVKLIKSILKSQYSLQPFDIFMSIDDGKDCDVLPSVTIRFYAIRNNDYYISHDESNLEKFIQPILIQSIN